jgi:fluoride exporter
VKTILLIGSGGFIGSIARYGLQQLIHKIVSTTFPLGILLVNLLGCFAIGLIYGMASKSGWITADWKAFLAIGICGGFTTFSSFSFDNIKLLQSGEIFQAFLYIAASLVIGLFMTWIGILLTGK